jgi:hypothetical protein
MATKYVKIGVETSPETSFMSNIGGRMDTVHHNICVFKRYVLSVCESLVKLICRFCIVTTE